MRLPTPRSLQAQLLLGIAAALLLAQGLSAILLYRATEGRREAGIIHAAAFRLLAGSSTDQSPASAGHNQRLERTATLPLHRGETHDAEAEAELRQVLADQDFTVSRVLVIRRPVADDPQWQEFRPHREKVFRHPYGPPAREMMVAAIQRPGSPEWVVARVPYPTGQEFLLVTLIGQTLFIYLVLVGAVALLMRRIARPLALLTRRIKRFAGAPNPESPLVVEGPEDLRQLIEAHNAMEARIAALIDEKDVMLGAIGHDLKTPLAALRVRIESVPDEGERGRMAGTIEDIVHTLDDILSLARIGRSNEPIESTELSALIGAVVEEYEDMGEPVTVTHSPRIVAPLRATWLRRALRNLIGNALRYGAVARVSLVREGNAALVRIDDDGPGIAPEAIGQMLEPFIRGDPSRNSETGGAGLGLTLARAIAEQHGGALTLTNRVASDGTIEGLTATIRLPLVPTY